MTVRPILDGMRSDAEKIQLLVSHAMERTRLLPDDLASLRGLLDHLTLQFAALRKELDPSAGGQNLASQGDDFAAAHGEARKGASMISEKLTHGVEVRSRDAERAEVVIEVHRDSEEFDTAAILARAWACLAEAISDHKAAVETSRAAAAPDTSQPPTHAPGSGAWWEG